MTANTPGPAPSVVAALESLGLPYRVLVHTAPVRSLEEAAAARGVEVVDVVKTLVVRRGEGDYLFVLVPGGRSISWPKLRGLLAVSRMSMPPADEAFAATGEVTLGSGVHEVAIAVDALSLLERTAATVADVTEPE